MDNQVFWDRLGGYYLNEIINNINLWHLLKRIDNYYDYFNFNKFF